MKFLFGMYRLLSTGDFADPQTTKHYMQKIQLITKGYLWWLFEMKKTPQDEQDYMQVEEWDEKGPKTNEPTDWIAMVYQSSFEPQMFCDSLVLLHQFQTLFPGETPFVQRIFRKHSPEYWKLINAHKDKCSTSDLWVSISLQYYQDIPVGVKEFGIDYQIQVWMAMDATKKLAELLQISEEDNTFNFLKDINPQNFRINVIERFKIERSIEVDLPNALTQDRKQMLCAVTRSSYQESNIEISSWEIDLLVPALNRNFFFLDDLVFVPWIDTLKSQDWSQWEDAAAQDFGSKTTSALMNYLSRYMRCNDEGSATNLHTARRDLESLSSAGGLFHNAAPIYNCLEYISSAMLVLLLYTDYAAEFDAVQYVLHLSIT